MTVPMALMDYCPVVIFLLSGILLMRDLYHWMSKGNYAVFSAGIIIIFMAGFYKATWKLLYAANVCDFEALNRSFFPMQSTGFLLAGLGMMAMLRHRKEWLLTVPPVYSSPLLFILFMVAGTGMVWGGLAYIALRLKKKGTAALLALSFVCMLGMGYLSSKDFSNPNMNWIGQGVNLLGMVLLFISCRTLHKAGLARNPFEEE